MTHFLLRIKTVPMGNDVAPARGEFPSSPGGLIPRPSSGVDEFHDLWNTREPAEKETQSGSAEASTEESGVWMGTLAERVQSEEADEQSAASSRDSDTFSNESMVSDVMPAGQSFLLNDRTGKYHEPSSDNPNRPSCYRGSGFLTVLDCDTFHEAVGKVPTAECCFLCFPVGSRYSSGPPTCLHICAQILSSGGGMHATMCGEARHISDDAMPFVRGTLDVPSPRG